MGGSRRETVKDTTNSTIVFSTPNSPQFKDIIKIIEKYLPVLHTDDTMSDILSNTIKLVAKRSRTIGNTISPSLFPKINQYSTWLSTVGFYKCGHAVCRAC